MTTMTNLARCMLLPETCGVFQPGNIPTSRCSLCLITYINYHHSIPYLEFPDGASLESFPCYLSARTVRSLTEGGGGLGLFRLGGFFVYCPTPGFTLGDEMTWLDIREQRTGTHAPDPFATRLLLFS